MSCNVKYDDDKLPYYTVLCTQFPNALKGVIGRSKKGHDKYGTYTEWKNVPDGYNRYTNALLRHLFYEGEDDDTEMDHDIAVAWNALARIELRLKEQNDKK